jgi:hypothetical protein
MDNRPGHSNDGNNRSMTRNWYKYTIVDLYSSHFHSRLSFFRLTLAWAPVTGICLVLLVLGSIAAIIVLSLIVLYLPSKGNGLVVDNPNDGIEIITIINFLILISCFKEHGRFTWSLPQISSIVLRVQ